VAVPTKPTSEARLPGPAPARSLSNEGGGCHHDVVSVPPGALKAREGVAERRDESLLSERRRTTTVGAGECPRPAGTETGTETETDADAVP